MEVVSVLFRQVIIMFILMFIGYFAYKRKIISDQGSRDLGAILLNIAVPVVVISNFCVEATPERINDLLLSGAVTLIAMFISVAVSVIFFHKTDRIAEFSSAFSNAGFVGIPLVQATFGSGAVFYISIMIVLVNVLQWTYGVFTITDDRSVMDLRKVAKNPVVLAVAVGMIVFFARIQLPSIVSSIFSIISGLNTPLAMLVSGVYLAQSDLLAMLKKKRVYFVSAVRLLVVPVITLLVFRLLNIGSATLQMSILLAAACPVGSNVAVFARLYDKDFKSGVEYVCVSTLLCLATLPAVIWLASLLIH